MYGLCSIILGLLATQAGVGADTRLPTASAADRLIQDLPEDSVAALIVDRLGEHFDPWRTSASWERIQALPSFQLWLKSTESERLTREVAKVEALLGMSSLELIRSILGQATVLSLHPDATVQGGYAGLVLVQPPDPARLRGLIKRLEALAEGERKGQTLVERNEGERVFKLSQQGPANTYAFAILDDGRFAWSNSENLIRLYLKRVSQPTERKSPIWLQGSQPKTGEPVLVLRLSDQLWKANADQDRDEAEAEQRGIEARVKRWLASCRGIALELSDQDGLSFRLMLHFPPSPAIESLTGFLAAAPDLAPYQESGADEAMIASAGLSFDSAAVGDLLLGLLAEKDPISLKHLDLLASAILGERDSLHSLLAGLGPESRFLLCLTDSQGPGRLLQRGLDLRLAVRYQGGQETASQLKRLLQASLALAALDQSKGDQKPRLDVEDGPARAMLKLVSLERSLFASISDGWMTLGNTDLLDRAWPESLSLGPQSLDPLTTEPGLKVHAQVMSNPLQRCLARNREYWVAENSRANGTTVEQATREFDQAQELLGLLRRVTYRMWVEPDSSRLTQEFRLLPAEPRTD